MLTAAAVSCAALAACGGSTATKEAAPAAPIHAAPATLVLSMAGNGVKQSPDFTVHNDQWTIRYTYNCAKFSARSGNFQVFVTGVGGRVALVAVNELGASGSSSTVQHGAGTYYLGVNSECDWTIKAID
jgi:opacity protein-like surface antigen